MKTFAFLIGLFFLTSTCGCKKEKAIKDNRLPEARYITDTLAGSYQAVSIRHYYSGYHGDIHSSDDTSAIVVNINRVDSVTISWIGGCYSDLFEFNRNDTANYSFGEHGVFYISFMKVDPDSINIYCWKGDRMHWSETNNIKGRRIR